METNTEQASRAVGSGDLLGLPIRDLAGRIYAHLKQFEADKNGVNKPHNGKPGGLSDYYCSGAVASGRWVSVWYISYQGPSKLTKREAAHYLSLLDGGFVGRHYEAFRRFPCPNTSI